MSEIHVMFVAGFGPIVTDVDANLALYRDTLGLPLEAAEAGSDYFHGGGVDGVKHFGMWPLHLAAESCFGSPQWPSDVPAPTAWIEFDVEDIDLATRVLREQGYRVLVEARREPWGQTVTRVLGPDAMLVSVTVTPFLR